MGLNRCGPGQFPQKVSCDAAITFMSFVSIDFLGCLRNYCFFEEDIALGSLGLLLKDIQLRM
jgi:hypothetical protein